METEADFWFEKSKKSLRSRKVANDRFVAAWVCPALTQVRALTGNACFVPSETVDKILF